MQYLSSHVEFKEVIPLSMGRIIVHIGAPRTGTTVLQKNLFPNACKNIIYSKRAYASSARITNKKNSTFTKNQYKYETLLKSCRNDINNISPSTFTTELLVEPSVMASNTLSGENDKSVFNSICEAIGILQSHLSKTKKSILISSERLCDTSASLFSYSSHKWADQFMPWQTLCEAIKIVSDASPQITICLRSPIPYLRSKYIRTFFQRRSTKRERDLSPTEFIQKQATLENSNPGTSALAPAMHSEFIKQLERYAFVNAFGFKEILVSKDVFLLMGLQGEDKYAFQDFPRENKLHFSGARGVNRNRNQTGTLQYGFHDRITKAQMFE